MEENINFLPDPNSQNQPAPEPVLPQGKPSLIDRVAKSIVTKVVVVVLILGLLAFGGYKAYGYLVNNPEKIWADTSAKMLKVTSAHFDMDLSYSEQLPKDEENSDMFLGEGNVSFGIKGQGDTVINASQSDADFDMDSKLSAQLGSLGITYQFQSKKLANSLYYKFDGDGFGALFGGSGKSEWVKYDLNAKDSPLEAINQVQKNQIIDAFKKAKIMKPVKVLGSETIDGAATWHYQAELDKQELKNYISAISKTVDRSADDFVTNSIIDKIQFQKLEIWIGKSDHLIRQIEIQSNSPGFLSGSLGEARNKSRDARRLSDVHQIQTALELFYNDNGHYPVAANGQPSSTDGGQYNMNYYIRTFPQAPTPADGSCTDANNKYVYEQLNNGQDYRLTFCLGHDSGGLKAGIAQANNKGIKTVTPSGAGSDISYINNLPFTGILNLKLKLSKLNSSIRIDPPSGSVRDANQN